ncbi:MAG: sodium-dependent bicarbonate transport family permease [Bacillota bacterium]
MNEILASLAANAANPAVLFFLIGLAASLLKVELPLPGGFRTVLTVYLMAAIGFKGGVAVSETGLAAIWLPALVVALLGAVQPVWLYPLARYAGRMAHVDAIALSATYASVSAVTFASAMSQLTVAGIPFEGSAPALMAVMEVPGVIVALGLHQWMTARSAAAAAPAAIQGAGTSSLGVLMGAVTEVLRSKSVFVLVASLGAGFLAGPPGMALTKGFFVDPFQGLLTLFLLEMGLEAGARLGALRRTGPFLLAFGLLLPLAQGALGVALGDLIGLSVGGATLMGVLSASASYIAAPAAVRSMVPEANPSIYITSALGITFPFNVVIGIPLYLAFAQYLAQ